MQYKIRFRIQPSKFRRALNFTFLTYVNDTLERTSYGSVNIQVDLHDEMHDGMHDEVHDEVREDDNTTVEDSTSNAKLSNP